MPMHLRRPHPGRLLDVIVVVPLLVVFLGLAVYHYARLDRSETNLDQADELSKQNLGERTSKTGDWPQWRGPQRDGVSTETDIVTDWPSGGPKALWEAKVGEGFASVSVAKGRTFTIFQDGDHEAVVAWNAETGQEIWRFRYPCSYKNDYGNGPRSTPTIDGDLLYSVGGTGLMYCLKAFTDNPKGEMVWHMDLLAEFGAKAPQWGVAFSPLVEGERVFIMPGGPDSNSLAALDKLTGKLLWKMHDDHSSYSSPIGATFRDERHILFFTGSRLVSVNPATGDQLWDYPWPNLNDCNIATPLIEQDYVFISASYGKGCAMLKIDKDAATWKPTVVYVNNRMRNHFSTCVRHKDHLYGFDDSNLTCMDFRTGKIQWKERGFDKGSVLLVNDQLIVYGANGLLALAEANPKAYVEKARLQFSEQQHSCWSVPVVATGRLFVRDQKKLVCFDVKSR